MGYPAYDPTFNQYATLGLESGLFDPLVGGAATGASIPDMATLNKWWNSANALNTDVARGAHDVVMRAADAVPLGKGGGTLSRFAANPRVLGALKFAAPVAALGGVMGAGDVLFGGDSLANKAMDTAGMAAGAWGGVKGAAAGAAAGSVVPVVGTAAGAILGGLAGAGAGKFGSDSLQWLFGDKKSQEQRKMEEALIALKGGVI